MAQPVPACFWCVCFDSQLRPPTARTSSPRLSPQHDTAEVLKTEIEATVSVKYGRLLHKKRKKKSVMGGAGHFICVFFHYDSLPFGLFVSFFF